MNQSFVFEKLTKWGGFLSQDKGLSDSVTASGSPTPSGFAIPALKNNAPRPKPERALGPERERERRPFRQTFRLRRRRMIPAPLMATRPVARSTMLAGSGTGVSVGGLNALHRLFGAAVFEV